MGGDVEGGWWGGNEGGRMTVQDQPHIAVELMWRRILIRWCLLLIKSADLPASYTPPVSPNSLIFPTEIFGSHSLWMREDPHPAFL